MRGTEVKPLPITPDLAARKILVAAFLYYVLDAPTMSDGMYDKLSQIAADGWDQLDPVRQWQLDSPDATRASGAHFKYTAATIGAAREEHARIHRRFPPMSDAERHGWKQREDGLRYCTAV
jgi:hypothetical protein